MSHHAGFNMSKEQTDWVMVPREPTPEMLDASIGHREPYLTDAHLRVLRDGFATKYRAMLAAAPASPSPAGGVQGVTVKPLEWKYHGDWTVTADTPFGVRKISENRGQWFNYDISGAGHGPFNELDDAEAHQQTDYEQRILSALSPSGSGMQAVTDEMVERAAPIVAFRTPEAWAKENDQFKSYYLKQARDFLTAAISSQAQTTGGVE